MLLLGFARKILVETLVITTLRLTFLTSKYLEILCKAELF